jgi:hypothetical protein
MIVEVVRGSGPAVRRANPVREPGRFTGRATTDKDTALPQAPPGPRAAVTRMNPQRPRPETDAGRRNEVLPMATIKKVCNKIERMSVLQGWRMRWHMQ